MAQGTMVNVPVSIALSAPVNGNFTAITVTDSAGNQNTCTLGGNRTYWLGVDDPTPAAAPSPASGNSPAPGAPSCTTVNGYYPGGMAGHVAPSGECARRHEWQPVNQADIKPIIRCPVPVG